MSPPPPQAIQLDNQLYTNHHAHQNDSNKMKKDKCIYCCVTRGSDAKHKKNHERQPATKSLRNMILQEIVMEIENECMKVEITK